MIIYQGPSLIDNKPIIVVAIEKSNNKKTGDVVQTYILRADIDPLLANRTGEDYSICGECPLKGIPSNKEKGTAISRKCYVSLHQAPLGIYKKFKNNGYELCDNKIKRNSLGYNRIVRVGSYGDGAAVPQYVWDELVEYASGHTAYTHNHGDPRFYMKSVESLQEAEWNWNNGYRTFRIVKNESQIVKSKEILCPSNKGVKCVECKLCSGSNTKAKSIAIEVHGAGSKWFKM
jgi:hypothetical protein